MVYSQVNVSELGLVTPAGKVVWGEFYFLHNEDCFFCNFFLVLVYPFEVTVGFSEITLTMPKVLRGHMHTIESDSRSGMHQIPTLLAIRVRKGRYVLMIFEIWEGHHLSK